MGKLFAVAVTVITLVSAGVFCRASGGCRPTSRCSGLGIDQPARGDDGLHGRALRRCAARAGDCSCGNRAARQRRAIRIFPGGADADGRARRPSSSALEVLALMFVGTKVWAKIFLAPAAGERAAHRCAGGAVRVLFPLRRAPMESSASRIRRRSTRANEQLLRPRSEERHRGARRHRLRERSSFRSTSRSLLTMHSKDVGHSLFIPAAAPATGLRSRARHPRALHGDGDRRRPRSCARSCAGSGTTTCVRTSKCCRRMTSRSGSTDQAGQ